MNFPAPSSRFGFAGLLLVAGLVLWTIAAWPLPRIFSAAIPFANVYTESQVVRPIAPGDHLQLLYHFWLGQDALAGHTPFFHNVYEFNLGDDAARFQPYLYYMPFSLVYAAIAPSAGHAAGWNAAGLASVLLGVLFIGLLARRFTASRLAAWLATWVAISFPYRWIVLFTGSPTGFAMAFPPLLAYGLDRAIRDRSPAGGLLAGLALFFAYATDLHAFYFCALATPFFGLLSFGLAEASPRRWPAVVRESALPLLPFAFLAVAAIATSSLLSRHLAKSVMASGRALEEVAAFSPPASGLLSTDIAGMASHAYVGIPLLVLLAAGLAFWVLPLFRRPADDAPPVVQRLAVFALVAAIVAVVLLALGIHGPFEGLSIRIARKLVPKYTMIRQTVKIYCLVPPLLAILLALLFDGLFRPDRRRLPRWVCMSLFSALVLWTVLDALAQTAPGFCRLPRHNAAYAAVAADEAANAGRPAHALALPLWPGDSHGTSLYEYAITLSRVRLVNGYAPAVPAGYFENIFKKYESLNQGLASAEQLDDLLALGVRHLIFHANAFPEKVSPFPGAATLRALVGHPRLALIADDGQTFAFRILPPHPIAHVPHANWTEPLYAAARHWNWNPPRDIPNGQAEPLLWRTPAGPAPGLRFLLRLGPGSSEPLLVPPGSQGISSLIHPIAGLPDWHQADMPSPTGGLVNAISGAATLAQVLVAAGELPTPRADGSIHIPPALLFHAGHSAPGNSSVSFGPETVPAGNVLYGPNLPFPPGIYDVEIACAADRPAGTFRLLTFPSRAELASAELAGAAIRFPALSIGPEPLRFEFAYNGQANVQIRDIVLRPATLQLRPVAAAP